MKHAMKDTGTGRYSTFAFAGSRQPAGAISSLKRDQQRGEEKKISRKCNRERSKEGEWEWGLGLVRRGCSEQ
jgi:phage portal protein BeeE